MGISDLATLAFIRATCSRPGALSKDEFDMSGAIAKWARGSGENVMSVSALTFSRDGFSIELPDGTIENGAQRGEIDMTRIKALYEEAAAGGNKYSDSNFVDFHPTRVPHRTPVAHDRLWTDHHGCNGARQRSRRQHQGRTARQRQRRRRTGTPRAAGTTEKQPSSTRQQQRRHQDSKHWISLRPRRSMSPWCMHHAPWLLHSASRVNV